MTGSPLSAIAGLGSLAIGASKIPGVADWFSKLTMPTTGTGRDAFGNLLPGYVLDTSGQPVLIPGNTGTGTDVRTGSGFQGTQNVGTVNNETYNPYAPYVDPNTGAETNIDDFNF
jgi:hypothetical protein